MTQQKLTDEVLQEAIDAWYRHDRNETEAGQSLNLSRTTYQHRLKEARRLGVEPSPGLVQDPEIVIAKLNDEIRTLTADLQNTARGELSRQAIRNKIFELSENEPSPPKWLLKPPPKSHVSMGVPTLFASDWHWGEKVNSAEINFANSFDVKIAHQRAQKLVTTAIDLLFHRFKSAEYPGLVLALGGDMVTGDIHDELTATNDLPIMPAVIDLFGVLVWMIDQLRDRFDSLFIPCVTGNHGRTTKKIQSKGRNVTNYDWLLYCLLAKHYEKDPAITFHIPDGPDARYKVYDHRYLLTHGDQFRGGNGIAGVLMPIERGRHKKSTRDTSMNRSWDTMILGHFHQLIMLPKLIVNGSLKGLDEWAFSMNFSYERPSQACWITHPDNGITFQLPIYVDEPEEAKDAAWVSWPEDAK